ENGEDEIDVSFFGPYPEQHYRTHPGCGSGYSGPAECTQWNLVAHKATWMCWEAHVKLNTPGQPDGLAEFYVDGSRLVYVPDLKMISSSSSGFENTDWQSNIGGNPGAEAWPFATNWWYLDSV